MEVSNFIPCFVTLTANEKFYQRGQLISYGKDPIDNDPMSDNTYNQVYADITTSFTLLIGIFFPSVTGMYVYSVLYLRNFFRQFQ